MSGSSQVDEINPAGGGPPQSGQITCGACNAVNPTGGQFCAGCGHALSEPCSNCAKPVLLTQAFCGSCGNDLVATLAKRVADLEGKIAEAITCAKERDFTRSKGLIAVVTREKDYRFREVVANAKIAQEKIDSIAEQESESASDRIAAAQEAYEIGDSVRVVELLGDLSPKLLSEEAKNNLRMSRSRLEQLQQAEQSLEEAFSKRDWASSGAILDRLLELQPDDESVAKLAVKVGKKLVAKAAALRESHKYVAASNMLECVPSNAHGVEFEELNALVGRVLWIAEQFKGEPFSTPTLGRLAKFWVEISKGDPQGTAVLERISKKIKGSKASPRDLFAPFVKDTQSWVGGPIGALGYPQCIDAANDETLRRHPGQFNVAIGLALQGIGRARITEDFTPKQGLIKRLRKKQAERVWGLDIGSFALKAVCLEVPGKDEGRPTVVGSYVRPLDTGLARNVPESKVDETIRAAVEVFLDECDVESVPVWVSFPGRELVSRFVKLPPVADKQAKLLFEKEVDQRIPLPLDEVSFVQNIGGLPTDELTSLGRPSFVSAAKKQYIDRYLENLSLAGLTPAGLQATPVALTNFAATEFADDLTVGSDDGDDDMEIKVPTVAVVDCGAEMTTVLLINAMSSWFWSFESGGSEFTRLVGRATKKTHSDAESFKRNLTLLERPESQFEMVTTRIDEMQGRLYKLISDVLTEHEEFDIRQTWCCGGGSLTHGWVKRVLCDKR